VRSAWAKAARELYTGSLFRAAADERDLYIAAEAGKALLALVVRALAGGAARGRLRDGAAALDAALGPRERPSAGGGAAQLAADAALRPRHARSAQ